MTAGGTWRSKPASQRAPRSAVASERLAPRQVSRQSLETATNGSHRNTHRRKIAKNHPLDREKTQKRTVRKEFEISAKPAE